MKRWGSSKRTTGGYLAKSIKKQRAPKKNEPKTHRKTQRIMSSMLPSVLNH